SPSAPTRVRLNEVGESNPKARWCLAQPLQHIARPRQFVEVHFTHLSLREGTDTSLHDHGKGIRGAPESAVEIGNTKTISANETRTRTLTVGASQMAPHPGRPLSRVYDESP